MGAGAEAEEPVDRELLRRMQRGEEAALEALYARYAGLVYTLALRVVGDGELAREVLQDTFLRSWDGADSYDAARGRVAWWLMGIARNGAVDLLRSRPHQARLREQGRLSQALAAADASASPAVAIATSAITNALATLSPAQRAAIELAYYGGLTQTEIARELNEPVGTIKSRTRDAMERLRKALGPRDR